tara:strand:- start:76 stop:345 length:270 start_codon:yes stop_codon:yes gene_type:complete
MKNYKEIIILTVLFIFLSILIFHYYINIDNTSIEFFKEDDKKMICHMNKEEKLGKKVLKAKEYTMSAAVAVGKAINEFNSVVNEVSKNQ